jgi:hypothetical protein
MPAIGTMPAPSKIRSLPAIDTMAICTGQVQVSDRWCREAMAGSSGGQRLQLEASEGERSQMKASEWWQAIAGRGTRWQVEGRLGSDGRWREETAGERPQVEGGESLWR